MNNFDTLPLSATLKSNLQKHGFTEPTPVQAQAIEPALSGRDLVVTAQTGTGKTLAFVLPILHQLGRGGAKPQPHTGLGAVILTPTRELAIQVEKVFVQMAPGTGVRVASAVGGVSEATQLRAIRSGAQVLIATPGRLFDFLGRKLIDLSKVRVLALDEADRMLDMGFLPTVKKIIAAIPAERQTMFFSATMESSVKHLVEAHVRNAVRVAVGAVTKHSAQVELRLYDVEQDNKLGLLSGMLRQEKGSFLVFVRTKRGADRLSKRLALDGVKAAAIHGNRTQSQRNRALEGFQRGHHRVLVATDVASRGIHVDGISHVVNYDLPQMPEDFIHRVGRTGRAGANGTASTFATRSERAAVALIERTLDTKLLRFKSPEAMPVEKRHSAPPPPPPDRSAARRHSGR